jgi:Mrp family chromosome partitioning ATPase
MGGVARARLPRREGVREGLTIVAATVAAFAAGAAGLALARSSEQSEATAVARGGSSPGEPLRSEELARRALREAGARGDAQELLEHLSASQRPGGEVAFTVEAVGARAARRLAAGYARAWADASRGQAARVRVSRQERDVAGAALIGAAIGLLAGLLLAVLREGLDVRRTSSRSVAARLGLAELGRVPEVPGGVEEAYRQGSSGSVAYERLAARVAAAASHASARVVAVCGTVAEERGEQVAAGLAAALAVAQDGRKVAVVELDPARPVLRRQFALARRPGASEVASGEASLDQALAEPPGVAGLCVLVAGAGPAPAGEAAGKILGALRTRFDMVVVAGPPLLPIGGAAASPVPSGVDALLLGVALRRTRHSRRPRVSRIVEALDVPVLGFVLMASAPEEQGPGMTLASAQRAPDFAACGDQARHDDQQQQQ